MKLPLAYYGDPILRKKVVPIDEITDEIRQLANDMIETMRETNGIGIAAPQIHRSIAIFITEVPIPERIEGSDEINWLPCKVRVCINLKILSHSEETWTYEEGCLSIPGIYGAVPRPIKIKVQAMDLDGKVFEEEFSWLDARTIMHENDHINGVLFVDRMPRKERDAILQAYVDDKMSADDKELLPKFMVRQSTADTRHNLVGEMNEGWPIVVYALSFERTGIALHARVMRSIERLVEYVTTTERDGRLLSEDPMIRAKIADLYCRYRAARLVSSLSRSCIATVRRVRLAQEWRKASSQSVRRKRPCLLRSISHSAVRFERVSGTPAVCHMGSDE